MLRSSAGGRTGPCRNSGTTWSCRRPRARSGCCAARKWRAARRVSPVDSNHSAALSWSVRSRARSLVRSSARSTWRTRWWYRKLVRSSSSGTRNRLPASMRRSSDPASCLPVTAAQAASVSMPRTEVSSMNWTTSGGCCSRTSETKYPAAAWLRISSARATRAGSLLPRSDSAAICSAAAQPSLLRCSSANCSAATSTPNFASRSRLSAREKYRSRSRSSHNSPAIRSRCSRSGGSLRLDNTSWACSAGQRSTRSVMADADPAAAAWKSSTMTAEPAGSFAASFAIDAVTSADMTLSIASRLAASAPNSGTNARGA